VTLFKIRREVMQALDEYSKQAFHDRLFAIMRDRHADACAVLGLERARDDVDRGIEKAIGYAIVDEDDIERFVHMLFERGFDFDVQIEWAKKILQNKKLSGSAKVSFLAELGI